MYSAKINGQATTFGTSGMLYRSNKLMYDRTTNSIWNQFTGEPVIGPLARAGIKLPFFPVNLTTWGEWLEEHPDTTVISNDTGIYPPETYLPESDPQAIYNSYFTSPRTMFPVTDRNDRLETKAVVLGLGIGESFKAYPVAALQVERVVNDTLGGDRGRGDRGGLLPGGSGLREGWAPVLHQRGGGGPRRFAQDADRLRGR